MPKRYIRRLMIIVTVFLLAVLMTIIGDRAELGKRELRVESEDTAPEIYPLAVRAYAVEGNETEYTTPTPTSTPKPTSTPRPTPTPTPEQTPAVVEEEAESDAAAPLNDGSDGQSAGNITAKVNVAYSVCLTAYCPCEICCGEWAAIRPVDEYGNKIVYTSTGALAVQGETVAVNPQFIPHGSYVYVQDPNGGGWQEFRATDSSGQMNHIDVYFNDHTAALRSGYSGYKTVYWSAEPIDLEALATTTPDGGLEGV